MIVGTFRYDPPSDTYSGFIRTLSMARHNVMLQPLRKSGDREPDYRVVQEVDGGVVELGAAWQRVSDRQQAYLSVSLDDPALSRPLSLALFLDDRDATANLVWNRPAQKPAPDAGPRRGGTHAPRPGTRRPANG